MRLRVFCASLADVFDNQVDPAWRSDLFELIKKTPNLDWLLLTKRPQNMAKMLPADWGSGYDNVWLGATVENQVEADRRLPHLTGTTARVRFLSCEPLLGPVDIRSYLSKIDWVITGGESGDNFRPADADWFRSLRDQCSVHSCASLFKQWEGRTTKEIKAKGRALDGVVWNDFFP